MEFTNSLKHWFYYLSTQAAKPTSRVLMMDASGNPTGSTTLANLAAMLLDMAGEG